MSNDKILEISDLSVSYKDSTAIDNVSFTLSQGEVLGIVGESGSGKSTLLKSILGLLDDEGKITGGEVIYRGENLIDINEKKHREICGSNISMIFQYPMLSLDPIVKIEDIFYDSLRFHNRKVSREAAREKMLKILEKLNFESPKRVAASYPFELSGGMCQRVTIGIAMMTGAEIILADEPTSALDVKSQLQVIDMLNNIIESNNTSLILVTHNMGLVANIADNIGVMIKGKLVEFGAKQDVLNNPMHEYTRALIDSVPKMNGALPQLVSDREYKTNGKPAFCSDKHWYLR